MALRLQIRHDTSANWVQANPVLMSGEFGYDVTTKQVKVGDGQTAWNTLPYTLTGPSAEPIQDTRTDYVYPYSYCGKAPKDSSETQTIWTIKRIQVTVAGEAVTSTAYGVSWSNRYNVTYT